MELSGILLPSSEADMLLMDVIYEYEGWSALSGWGFSNLGKRPRFIDKRTGAKSAIFEDVVPEVPVDFVATSEWTFLSTEGDHQGWMYASSCDSEDWYSESTRSTTYRRRVWSRNARHNSLILEGDKRPSP